MNPLVFNLLVSVGTKILAYLYKRAKTPKQKAELKKALKLAQISEVKK